MYPARATRATRLPERLARRPQVEASRGRPLPRRRGRPIAAPTPRRSAATPATRPARRATTHGSRRDPGSPPRRRPARPAARSGRARPGTPRPARCARPPSPRRRTSPCRRAGRSSRAFRRRAAGRAPGPAHAHRDARPAERAVAPAASRSNHSAAATSPIPAAATTGPTKWSTRSTRGSSRSGWRSRRLHPEGHPAADQQPRDGQHERAVHSSGRRQNRERAAAGAQPQRGGDRQDRLLDVQPLEQVQPSGEREQGDGRRPGEPLAPAQATRHEQEPGRDERHRRRRGARQQVRVPVDHHGQEPVDEFEAAPDRR